MRFTDNFIYWAIDQYAGAISGNSKFLPIMNVDFIWRHGGGWCGQAVQIFRDLASRAGLATRTWMNRDHVISEVFVESRGWIAVDPDYGIYWDQSFEDIRLDNSKTQIAENWVKKGWSDAVAASVASTYLHPSTPWYIDETDRSDLVSLQFYTEVASWVLPLFAVLLGYFFRTN